MVTVFLGTIASFFKKTFLFSTFLHPLFALCFFQMMLRVTGGSGSFHLDYQPKDISRVEYNSANRTLQVIEIFKFISLFLNLFFFCRLFH